MNFKWIQRNISGDVRDLIKEFPHIHPLILRILSARGVQRGDVMAYLNPSYEQLNPPKALKGVDEAVSRIQRAILLNETVFIHGDYDVDGVTSMALLYRNLKRLGIRRVIPYIPDRFEEGYGVSEKGIEHASTLGASLMITVDCGTKAHNELDLALRKGMDVIVTDHHEPGNPLPEKITVINPKLVDKSWDLAGVGVVFKLLQALYLSLGRDELPLKWDLDLVALGTIADIVPLQGENRVLAALGLEVLRRTKKAGIKALKRVAGLKSRILAWHVSFILAPRLNAAGRLSHAKKAFQLLITSDGEEALKLAQELNAENQKRQKIEEETLNEAIQMIEEIQMHENPVIVLDSPSWHEGVIGIVASRIVEKYWRPTLMIALKDGLGKGSARSIPGFPIYDALLRVENLFLSFGGHEMAAGFRIAPENIPALREKLNDIAPEFMKTEDMIPELHIDLTLTLDELSDLDFSEFMRLGPFGHRNPTPTFLLKDVEIVGSLRKVGDRHLAFRVRDGDSHIKVFAPGFQELSYELENGIRKADIVVTIDEDTYSLRSSIKLKAKDIRLSNF